MPLFDRDTLVDRPVLLDRSVQDDEEEQGEEETVEVETLGEGGGPVIHGIEFREGDYDIVASSNAVAVLAAGDPETNEFAESFRTSAIQLFSLKQRGDSIDDILKFSIMQGVSEFGLSEDDVELLKDTQESNAKVSTVDRDESDDVAVEVDGEEAELDDASDEDVVESVSEAESDIDEDEDSDDEEVVEE